MITLISKLSAAIGISSKLIAAIAIVSTLSSPVTITSYSNLVSYSTVPASAILDELNDPILDEDGGYIEEEA